MKNTWKKRLVAMIVAGVMVTSLFAGCGDTSEPKGSKEDTEKTTEATEKNDESKVEVQPSEQADVLKSTDTDELRYVMIYNPKIYYEHGANNASSLNTGTLASEIEVEAHKSSGLEEENEFIDFAQTGINDDFPFDEADLDVNRGDALAPEYEEGDIHEFYTVGRTGKVTTLDFECRYVGENCYLWTTDDANMDDDDVEDFASEFDEKIYDAMTKTFGEHRFAASGGKVHMLFHPMQAGLGGCFRFADLWKTGEYTDKAVKSYGINLNHAVLNVNSIYLHRKDILFGTMAHEYQHMLYIGAVIESGNFNTTVKWLNEALSGFAEESIYNGVLKAAQRDVSFNESERIRYGQSLYNFDNDMNDIGVYGSVFLFSEFLKDLAGDDVFSKIHETWKDSYGEKIGEADVLANCVPSSVKREIDKIAYPSSLTFKNDAEAFMSKLTLQFHLSVLCDDEDAPEFYQYVKPESLLYDQLDEANIEGGGRIIVAVKDGEFEIPEDADDGLIYVGLNEDFEVMTGYVYK